MGYPRKLLSADEDVELDLHPHWKALVRPVLVLLVLVPVASFGAARIPDGSAQTPLRLAVLVVAVVLLVWLTVLPFLRWVTTHYVVTDRRLIVRRGIIARSGRDMPLTRINDISFSHTVLERVLGCGTLVVESAGERGQLLLDDVPGVEAVQRRLYEVAAIAGRDHDDDEDDDRDDRDRGAYDTRHG
ncbi:PH domain-containing protein [Angustibacter peucedani]